MSEVKRIDDCLTSRDGNLYIEDVNTLDLVERFGSPIFVLSETQLRSNVQRFRRAFAEHWKVGPVDVLPALKANWTLASRRVLTEEGAGADVYSPGELEGALRAGVNPERISVNGGGKSEALVRRCVEAGVRITVEDLDEPELISRVAGELGKTAQIRLRVKPDFPKLWRTSDFTHEVASIDLAHQAYKAGIPAEYLPELGRNVLAMDNIELVGLHLHLGRHRAGLWYWRKAMKRYGRFLARLFKEWGGYQPKEIDIGGGFATPRDPHSKMGIRGEVLITALTYPFDQAFRLLLGDRIRYRAVSWMVKHLFAKKANRKIAPTIEEYGRVTAGTLREALINEGVDLSGVRLQIEPGRGLYGDAGIHLAKVKRVKRQTKPMELNWILTDTTIFFFAGGALEYNFHDFRVANRPDAEPTMVADIVGHSCYGDRILPFVRVPKVERGDVIAFLDTGAYQETSASNFNALPRPATILVNGDDAEVIKRAETVEDVYARDIIPDRLQLSAESEAQVIDMPMDERKVAGV